MDTTIFTDSLSRIATVHVSGMSGTWKVSEFFHPPPGELQGIGPKLAENLSVVSEFYIPPATFGLYRSSEKVPKLIALSGLERMNQRTPAWWHLAQLLRLRCGNHRELVDIHLPTGSQLGVRMRLPVQGDLMVRIPVDWEKGHNVGQPPSADDSWTWNAGTIFGVLE